MTRLLIAALVALTAATGATKFKPKPVRAALRARYAQMADAWCREDLAGVMALRAPDFFAIQANGQTWDRATVESYTRAAFAQVESTLTISFGIDTIDVRGDTADAAIDQHWLRRQQKGGRLRLVDTHAHQHETWVLRGGAWLLWRMDRVEPGAWIVDGKRIDPSKPYEPDAPPYRGD